MQNIVKRANRMISEYKFKRDIAIENEMLECETFYQMLIVHELGKSKFNLHKKRDMKQHWEILHELLSNALRTDDIDYHMGIYYEVIYSNSNDLHIKKREIIKKINIFFERTCIQEYIHGAYGLHIPIILNLATKDLKNAQKYADNLLSILATRYGVESKEYAMMKLHIIGEFYYRHRRDMFSDAMKTNYEYLKQYAAVHDSFFNYALLLYAYVLEEDDDDGYKLWMSKSEDSVEQGCEDENYLLYKSVIAWIKARHSVKENQKKMALALLVQAIEKYIIADNKIQSTIYGHIYLMAANICMEIGDIIKMYKYAQAGLEICKQLNELETELYYNLYNFIGIYYLRTKEWGIAEGFYSSSLDKIGKKLGKENENYFLYLNNLLFATLAQGKFIDTYFNEFSNLKDEKLEKHLKEKYINQLMYLITSEMPLHRIKKIYNSYVKYLGNELEPERIRTDTIFLSTCINQGILDNQTLELLEKLEKYYKDCYKEDIAIIYWNSQVIWKWSKGDVQTALSLAKRIVIEIPIENYIQNVLVLLNYIQLLILNKEYDEAKKQIDNTIDLLETKIVETGIGNILDFLTYIRVLLSMYIYIIKIEFDSIPIQSDETKLLLQRIVLCKTIDRELKEAFKCYSENDESMDFFYFKDAHRKLAALELRQKVGDLDTKEYYAKQKMQCVLELGEYEAKMNEKIPFQKLMQKFCLEDLYIPHDTICLEYFAYYDFNLDAPMLTVKDQENKFSFLVFAIAFNENQSQIMGIKDIPVGDMFEKQVDSLLEMTVMDENENSIEIIQSLNHLLVTPIWEYIEEKEKVYIGIDFLLQSLPLDVIFFDQNGETMNLVLVDSVRYVGEDTRINRKEARALIIGNPSTRIGEQPSKYSLPCAEIECMEIAKMLGTEAHTGENAKQSLLCGKVPNDIIHISTHGDFLEEWTDIQLKENILVNSYLEFAGCENWMAGKKEEDYGNGIVTSDDFLFMNLTNTKLVVLSCCLSGIGIARGFGHMCGLPWAIGVAGAENTISTLWAVDDCASAILMILFYRNLQYMGVSRALYEAKICLRKLTIKNLKEDDVLFKIYQKENKDIGTDDHRPYAHWKYWAGFVCQKGRGQ